MTASAISRQRLLNQHISGTKFNTVKQLVYWMGALQAQDYAMSKYAIGLRVKDATHHIIEEAINKAEIIRTHVLRPTWHFVTAEDARWMMELTAKNLNRAMSSNNKRLQLDEKIFTKCNTLIEKLLRDGKHLTRKEIMAQLEKKGIQTNDLRAGHIMFRAETELIVCNGIKRDKQLTYALFEERVAPSKKLTREEALAELAQRYFSSHGPASLQDFSWWSGLSMNDAKNGLELIQSNLASVKLKENIFWFDEKTAITTRRADKIFFLPSYDEFLISYKSREISVDPKHSSSTFTNNGIFNPVIVHNGRVIGLWKAEYKKEILVKLQFFLKPTDKQKSLCAKAAQRLAKFLGMKVKLV